LKPAKRRELVREIRQAYKLNELRACGLIGITRWTNRYQSRRDPQTELRVRLRDLASTRLRYGYRRLTVLLRREGWHVNTKRVYRLYREEGLELRMKKRAKRVAHARIRLAEASYPNQRWSMDFVSDRLVDGRWFRILTVVDQYTRECLCAHADRSQTGEKVSEQLERVMALRGAPESCRAECGILPGLATASQCSRTRSFARLLGDGISGRTFLSIFFPLCSSFLQSVLCKMFQSRDSVTYLQIRMVNYFSTEL
jgi:putative transposase